MSEKTIYTCDRCGKDFEKSSRFSVCIDRQMDGAGSMENIYDRIDLCSSCTGSLLQQFLNNLGWTDAQNFMSKFREQKKCLLKVKEEAEKKNREFRKGSEE